MRASSLSRGLVFTGSIIAAACCAQQNASPTACKSSVVGDLRTISFHSTLFNNDRTLRVWLPAGYDDPANSSKQYPVLYLLDGQALFDHCTAPGQANEWRVDETLTDLISRKLLEPIIVVGIDNAGKQRGQEFSPYPDLPPLDAKAPVSGDRFPDFLESEVVPYVTAHFRVLKGREHTAIRGASLGGLAAAYALVKKPDLFGLGLLESTSAQTAGGQIIRDTTPLVQGPVRVSVGVGTQEIGAEIGKAIGQPTFDEGFVQLNKLLAANFKAALFTQTKVRLTVQAGAHHSPQFWGERFPAAIQFSRSMAKATVLGISSLQASTSLP